MQFKCYHDSQKYYLLLFRKCIKEYMMCLDTCVCAGHLRCLYMYVFISSLVICAVAYRMVPQELGGRQMKEVVGNSWSIRRPRRQHYHLIHPPPLNTHTHTPPSSLHRKLSFTTSPSISIIYYFSIIFSSNNQRAFFFL